MIKIEWLAAFFGVNMLQFTSVPFELIMPMTSVKNHKIFSSNEGNDIIQKYPGVAAKINRYLFLEKNSNCMFFEIFQCDILNKPFRFYRIEGTIFYEISRCSP